ncbi:hypothetical protein SeMB42_g00771 [Synchytrium endobioticum]|uniref:Roadblock/LAMTOR2 domain-containing protein n=1 Tax=Synchytrium endobioticum TaxID=286115 RepID=A0A507DP87_9FUNG|nr:hypothetical protein SeLEV6574_g06080 [Synchytrium endobioticum]TPX53474.1 hypothetical protein SeMB42_g00771 [Synchytrium endobioticum]
MLALKPRVLSSVLAQAVTSGVFAALLLNPDGSVLAASANSDDRESKIIASIAYSIWRTFDKSASPSDATTAPQPASSGPGRRSTRTRSTPTIPNSNVEQLKEFACDVKERGRLCMVRIGKVLLCIAATEDAPLGVLMAKGRALKAYLEEPLSKIGL